MSLDDKILMLTIHRDNLANAKTFEDYRAVHVAYVEMLIGEISGKKQSEEAVLSYSHRNL